MRRIVISGPISIEEFGSSVERCSIRKTCYSMTTADSLISKIDKNRRTLLIIKSGRFGISRGQLYFYGKYFQQANTTTVVGKFDMSLLQKILLYILFGTLFTIFILSVGWEGMYTLIAIFLYHLLLFLLYKLFCVLSLHLFRKRSDEVIIQLNKILNNII